MPDWRHRDKRINFAFFARFHPNGEINYSAVQRKFLDLLTIVYQSYNGAEIPQQFKEEIMSANIDFASYAEKKPNGSIDTEETVKKFREEFRVWREEVALGDAPYLDAIKSVFEKTGETILPSGFIQMQALNALNITEPGAWKLKSDKIGTLLTEHDDFRTESGRNGGLRLRTDADGPREKRTRKTKAEKEAELADIARHSGSTYVEPSSGQLPEGDDDE